MPRTKISTLRLLKLGFRFSSEVSHSSVNGGETARKRQSTTSSIPFRHDKLLWKDEIRKWQSKCTLTETEIPFALQSQLTLPGRREKKLLNAGGKLKICHLDPIFPQFKL
jgi:hypothetical protein